MHEPIDILESYWNFSSFKPLQEEIINSVLNNDDTFALLPTGGGKSICFQVPALIKEGICVVISPLVSLMTDQINALQNKGIKAMALTSKYSFNDVDRMLDNCLYGNYKFLYLSPERLQQELVQDRIKQMNVNLIAVDEAHCISQWGNDFRPSYKQISVLRKLHPTVNVIALTASATKVVEEDIIKELDFIGPKVFRQSFHRENIAYMVFEEEDKHYRIEQILKKNKQSSIIYVRNRKSTISLSKYLENKGFTSTYYHGGLSIVDKEDHFNYWKSNEKQVMVATNAFGMGIDKADVKTVIHVNLPESIESYFQESGRAGRNGKKAYAIILKNKGDQAIVEKQFLGVLPTVEFIKNLYRKLSNYFQISYGEGELTTHRFNFSEFCKTYQFNSLIAYNALLVLDRTSIINLSTQFQKRTMVQVLVKNDALFQYFQTYSDSTNIIKSLLRTYGGIFDHEVKINSVLIADKASTTENEVIKVLKDLEKKELISLKLHSTDAEITFLQPREDDKTVNRIATIINQQNELRKKQVASVISYIDNNLICKSVQLLTYFGESKTTNCGICSVCIGKSTTKSTKIQPEIIDKITQLLEVKPLSSRAIAQQIGIQESIVTLNLQILLENNRLEITNTNTYKLTN